MALSIFSPIQREKTPKALVANVPAALSIPDDAYHYDEYELRVLTVREIARIQSFLDNFVFRSRVTTGDKYVNLKCLNTLN